MPTIKQLLRNIRQQQKNISPSIRSCIDKILGYIKKTYTPVEIAIMILLCVSLVYLSIEIIKEYLEELSRKKK